MNEDKYIAGLNVRREVLGEDNVKKALANVTEFNRPFFELALQYCWGEVWDRKGISKKTRSLINIAILTAMNRPKELKIHLGGAIRNGCTEEEIQEVLLQCAIYCGIPAATDSFAIAKEFLEGEKMEDNQK